MLCYNIFVKKRTSIILIVCLLVCVLAFAACATSRIPKLKTPVVRGNGGFYAKWAAIDGAVSYSVRVVDFSSNSELVNTSVTETSFSLVNFAEEDEEREVYVYVAALPADNTVYDKSAEGRCKITIPVVTDADMLQHAESVAPAEELLAAGIKGQNYTYYPATDMDLTLSFDKNISSIKPLGDYDLSGKFSSSYTIIGGTAVIAKSYMQQFDVGAAIQFAVTFIDGTSATHSVFVVDTVAKLIDPYSTNTAATDSNENLIFRGEEYIVYGERDGRSIEFTFFDQVKVNAVCVDGSKVSFSASKVPNKQVVSAAALQGLSQGVHYITLYTDKGAVTVPLVYIPEYSCAPKDVYVDIEGYPEIYIRWEANLLPAYYTVEINGAVSSFNEYPELITVNSFNATGKINISDSAQDTITVTAYLPESFNGKSYSAEVTSGDLSSYIPYLESTFTYLGSEENYYISSEEEWNTFVAYTALYYEDLEDTGRVYTENSEFHYTYPYKKVSFALGYDDWTAKEVVNTKYKDGAEQFREVIAYELSCKETSNNVFELELVQFSYKEPSKNSADLGIAYRILNESPLQTTAEYAHFSSSGNADGTFPIDEVTQTAEVSTSMQLYFAMEMGLRPVPVSGSSAERIYNKAREVMAQITDPDMSDYEVVHAIYDYLTARVVYDNAVAAYNNERTSTQDMYNDVYNYNCFYPEGVFDDGVAVCNGLSQAFVIMCAIEGIESVKIGGTVSGGAHAWNKVNIDGMWYVVDTTWGRASYQGVGVTYNVGEHDWLLVSEATASSSHKQDEGVYGSDIYAGGVTYDPYANIFYQDESGAVHDHKAASYEEFNAILAHYGAQYSSRGAYVICVSITFNSYFSQALFNNSNVTIPSGMTITAVAESMDRQAELIMVRN